MTHILQAPHHAPPPIPRRRSGLRWLAGAAVLALLWYSKLPELAFYGVTTRIAAADPGRNVVGLPRYQVGIERLPIEGLTRNASGLTFNSQTRTLFTVINRPAQVAELTTDGRLLRLIPLDGIRDPEGITYVDGDTYVISDEASHSLHWVRIGPDDQRVSVAGMPRLKLGIDVVHNASLEGVSWDARTNRLFVVKEKRPLRVLVISGLDAAQRAPGFDVSISEWKSSTASTLFMRDLSSLSLHEPTGSLLLLSDESALVVEYAPDGTPIGLLPLWRGLHGLQRSVPQPEGLAMGDDGAMYVLSEPNLFYRFDPPRRPAWAQAD